MFFLLPFVMLFTASFHSTSLYSTGEIKFVKKIISTEKYESAGVADIDQDGTLDIVSGAYWYKGPDFTTKNFIYQPYAFEDYYDDFSTILRDVNGDAYPDIITGGWWGETLKWIENPGKNNTAWKVHDVYKCGNVETTREWDIDGDGFAEVVPNNPSKAIAFYELQRDKAGKPAGEFKRYEVAPVQGHGLGCGDINGDGRKDLVSANGWFEAPANIFTGKWVFHNDFTISFAGSVPMIVTDVNNDGVNDLIVGHAHDYGLSWYEQKLTGKDTRKWIKHVIDSTVSQFHEMQWIDIDGDGKPELLTGKRYRAHQENDPGSLDPLGIYYYKLDGNSFIKHIISFGPTGDGKGTGIFMSVADLRGSGRKDIVAAGKDGLCVFYNEGNY
ncbi:MAG: VCBS repeat-containing protein [Bacteroidota bacterium]